MSNLHEQPPAAVAAPRRRLAPPHALEPHGALLDLHGTADGTAAPVPVSFPRHCGPELRVFADSALASIIRGGLVHGHRRPSTPGWRSPRKMLRNWAPPKNPRRVPRFPGSLSLFCRPP